ncbi:DNA protecting protein DprA [Leucobacter komagatae]|uniref:DNA protecting protein DprA n=1 Tax=Leucobacter komagatae TaxID=55969 RepID=A0A542Y4I7_9MICO|nr:DNA-processing protein DprA [Leucobacter komagatae]TQL42984.1 DNA protecting protein DprA [Leucobacter komagatae]
MTARLDSETLPLVTALGGERDLSERDTAEVFARVVWSRLAEPGDATAGTLVTAVGAAHALKLLGTARPARAAAEALAAVSVAEIGSDPALSQRQLAAGVKRWLPRLDRSATVQDLATAASLGMRFVTPGCPDWPRQLDDLGAHAPHGLWVRGQVPLLSEAALAVVGARACTGYGSHVTTDLTAAAASAGFSIVSGAAYGVDAVAHRTALAMDVSTVAVLAGGADRPYPASHDQLISRIADRGAVCSELVPGAAPTRWRFLQRNRLIAALSRAVLVTEAGVRSGTLNTAGHAAELGRALGAVPGPVTSAASAGCHRLVREYNASLITSGSEVLELLDAQADGGFGATDTAAVAGGGAAEDAAGEDRQPPLHLRVLDALPLRGGRLACDVAARAGITREEALRTLAELELLGYVAQPAEPGGGEPVWRLLRRA